MAFSASPVRVGRTNKTHGDNRLRGILAIGEQQAEALGIGGPGSGCSAADPRTRPGRFGHERCIELAGIHTGCLVEPNSCWGMVSDGSDRHLLQRVGRLWLAKRQSGKHPASGSTAGCVYWFFFSLWTLTPTPRRHLHEAAICIILLNPCMRPDRLRQSHLCGRKDSLHQCTIPKRKLRGIIV